MDTLRLVLVYLHLIGFATLIGGAITQYLTGRLRINSPMLAGAVTQVVTGLALAAPLRGGAGHEPSRVALGVKLVIALAILAMTFFSRHRAKVHRGHFLGIVALTLANAAIGVFWI